MNEAYRANPETSVGTIGCPIFLAKVDTYALSEPLLNYMIATLHDKQGIKYRFKRETGRDLCDVAQEKGWVTKYINRSKVD